MVLQRVQFFFFFFFAVIVAVLVVSPVVQAGSCSATLYVNDPFLNGLSFPKGVPSGTIQDWQAKNAGTDIKYSITNLAPTISIAHEGTRQGAVSNLDTETTIANRYGSTGWAIGSIYSSIHYQGSNLTVGQNFSATPDPTWVSLNGTDISKIANTTAGVTFTPTATNVYLIRITDSNDKNFERVVKLYVVSITATRDQLILRWDVLKDSEGLQLCGVEAEGHPIDPTVVDNSDFFGATPGWVIAVSIVLFVISLCLMISVIFLCFRTFRQGSDYNRIQRLVDTSFMWLKKGMKFGKKNKQKPKFSKEWRKDPSYASASIYQMFSKKWRSWPSADHEGHVKRTNPVTFKVSSSEAVSLDHREILPS